MAEYLPLSNLAARQYIDARQTYLALREAHADALQVRGGMYWHSQSDSLIRTSAHGSEKSLGKRSFETTTIYQNFIAGKERTSARCQSLKDQVRSHERMNKALYVGRVDPLITKLINRIDKAGVAPSFHVVGTHALYAYEAAAGVHLDAGIVDKRDVDILLAVSVSKEGDQALTQHDDSEDFSVVQALRAGILLDRPSFEAVIVDRNGGMAMMRTIAPQVFVSFKKWLSKQPSREPFKRGRDAAQALAVQQLIDDERLVVV